MVQNDVLTMVQNGWKSMICRIYNFKWPDLDRGSNDALLLGTQFDRLPSNTFHTVLINISVSFWAIQRLRCHCVGQNNLMLSSCSRVRSASTTIKLGLYCSVKLKLIPPDLRPRKVGIALVSIQLTIKYLWFVMQDRVYQTTRSTSPNNNR